jgi:hypothetical protein
MCEGSRVKMGYVTYGVGGKKKQSKTKVRLKNIDGYTRGERQEAKREEKQKGEGIPKETVGESARSRACVCVCTVLYNMAMCALAKWNLSTTSEIH